MTPAEIEQGRRLVEAATPGPWHLLAKDGHKPRTIFVADDALRYIARCEDGATFSDVPTDDDANAELIAWAGTHLPALLDAYEAAMAEVERLREGIDRLAANFCLNETDVAGFLSGGGA